MKAGGKPIMIVAAMVFAVAFAALSSPAFAQRRGDSGPPPPPPDPIKKEREEQAKAAKAAMDRIPDSKEKYDPWKIER